MQFYLRPSFLNEFAEWTCDWILAQKAITQFYFHSQKLLFLIVGIASERDSTLFQKIADSGQNYLEVCMSQQSQF